MAYKVITDLSADVTISLGGKNRKTNAKNQDQIEGYYLGKREIADNKKKSGISYIYFFQTATGNVGVWGKTDMDRKLSQANLGQMTLVKFEKMVPTPNGEMYKYSVAQDSDNSIEVSTTETHSEPEGYVEDSSDKFEEETEDDKDALQTAALQAAERKAKVQALLNKNARAK